MVGACCITLRSVEDVRRQQEPKTENAATVFPV